MIRLIGLLLVLFLPALALADAPAINAAPSTDLSIIYLSQIFGTVGNVLTGITGNLMGQIFYKFNQGIFVVAGMWLAYTTSTIVLRSAAEGSFMGGQGKASNWFTMLRIPLGMALLIPIPATGYEAYQTLVMEVVVQGVNLADTTWSWALQYLQGGGVLYMPPAQAAANASVNMPAQLSTAQSILASQTCMEISNATSFQNPAAGSQGGFIGSDPTAYSTYMPMYDPTGWNIFFPGLNNVKGAVVDQSTAACGYVNWNVANKCAVANGSNTGIETANAQVQCSMAQAATQQMVLDMTDAAKQYACSILGSTSGYCAGQQALATSDPAFLENVVTSVINAMMDYQNLMMPYMTLEQQSALEAYKAFIQQAQADGWIMAGRYYWDVSMLNDAYADLQGGTIPSPAIGNISNAMLSSFATVQAAQTQIAPTQNADSTALAQLVQKLISSFYAQHNTSANRGIQVNLPSASTNTASFWDSSASNGFNNFNNAILTGLFNSFAKPIINLLNLFIVPSVNPILFIHQLGVAMISAASTLWIGGAIAIFIVYVVAFICSSMQPLGMAVNGLVDMIKPIILVVVAMLFGTGITLAYYVPLYPYIIFTFASVGWFITVIEAMVAAPLVCLGLTHPEGHDFLGKAEQALMLMLSVFVRPVLLVIGLMGGMILSYVALLLLNTGYTGVITSLYGNVGADASGNSLLGATWAVTMTQQGGVSNVFGKAALILIVTPTLLVIFSYLVYMIIQQCYSLIHVLPENIMVWIGGQKSDTHVGQMAHQVEQAVSGIGSQAGGAAKEGMASVQKFQGQQKSSGGEG